jgi:hypothetical protein
LCVTVDDANVCIASALNLCQVQGPISQCFQDTSPFKIILLFVSRSICSRVQSMG